MQRFTLVRRPAGASLGAVSARIAAAARADDARRPRPASVAPLPRVPAEPSEASFKVVAGAASARASGLAMPRRPTGNSPRWQARGIPRCFSKPSRITLSQAQTRPRRTRTSAIRPPLSSSNAPSASTPRAIPSIAPSPTSTRAGRPRSASSSLPGVAKRRETLPFELPQHTQKLLQEGPARRVAGDRRRTRLGERRGAHAASPRSRAATAVDSETIEPDADDDMRRSARIGLQFDQYAADFSIVEPDIVRPLETRCLAHPPVASAREIATPTARLKVEFARAASLKGPGQRQGDARRRRAISSAGRGGRGPHAAIRAMQASARPAGGAGGRAGGCWWSRPRTAPPASAAGVTVPGAMRARIALGIEELDAVPGRR